ncbi:helix-turn-helix domain-containing protein [Tardiphaga alba]|uniref:helix-turn-helix domain-containing protein n=1 Tax=Tardiphaga alba TaxID=340268 RepID=UPI0038B60014
MHAFKKTTGLTPHQWIQSQRIERARNALANTSQPLAEIALECGFSDQSHFTRVFSKIVGSPPGNWRRHVKDAAL